MKMRQVYECYSKEDHEVWKILFERQKDNLKDKACSIYYDCLEMAESVLHAEAIPEFSQLNKALFAATGWTIEVTPGLIPASEFLLLLSERKFPSSTWLRRMDQLDYLEEPDMFHDIFGHVPMLFDTGYADFIHKLGLLGLKLKDHPLAIERLERFYWHTVEFGLIKEKGENRIFGAGILSSFGETNQLHKGRNCKFQDFDVEAIVSKAFRKDIMQGLYFASESLEQMQADMNFLEKTLVAKKAA
jgi:phenylalanine-4-hydroxylase